METREKIYIADDDVNIRSAIKTFLENEGYIVSGFENGDTLLASLAIDYPNLIILDVMMPGSDGFAVCKKIREKSTVPIIMLTARDSDLDYATGLSIGSDDYFTKPFSAMSLVMRVKAIFRRIEFEKQNSTTGNELINKGNITIDTKSKDVIVKGEIVALTPNEYGLLKYLFINCDRAVSRSELLENIWGYQTEIETRATDDTVRRLRKKIISSNVSIEAVWGFGFKLKIRDTNE